MNTLKTIATKISSRLRRLVPLAAGIVIASTVAQLSAYAQTYVAYAEAPAGYTGQSTNLALQTTYNATGFVAYTTNTAKYIDIPCRNFAEVGIQITAKGAASPGGTNLTRFLFNYSADGTTWTTSNPTTIDLVINGTNVISSYANISVGSMGFIRLTETRVTGINHVTNIVITPAYKPWRTGIGVQ